MTKLDRYVGRIVAVGKTPSGDNVGMYRISSRSFRNRSIVKSDKGDLLVVPNIGFERDILQNPYIAYTAMTEAKGTLVVSNGSHTDIIAQNIENGLPVKQALAFCLGTLDFEQDELSTPRIAAVLPRRGEIAWLAIVMRGSLLVSEVSLNPGTCRYVATYGDTNFLVGQTTALEQTRTADLAKFLIEDRLTFNKFAKPVASAAAVFRSGRWNKGSFNL